METIILNESNTMTAEEFEAKVEVLWAQEEVEEQESNDSWDNLDWEELLSDDNEEEIEESTAKQVADLIKIVAEYVEDKKSEYLALANDWARREYKKTNAKVFVNTHSEYEMKEKNVYAINERRRKRMVRDYEQMAYEMDNVMEWWENEGIPAFLNGKNLSFLSGNYKNILNILTNAS